MFKRINKTNQWSSYSSLFVQKEIGNPEKMQIPQGEGESASGWQKLREQNVIHICC